MDTKALLDEQDEDVRIAVGVLGSMRNSSPSQKSSSPPAVLVPNSPPSSSSSRLVNSAISIYETSKARSPSLVRYGAEMIETGVSNLSLRVGLDRYLPPRDRPTVDDNPQPKKRRTSNPPPPKQNHTHTRHRSSGSSSGGRHSRHSSASRKPQNSPPPMPQLPRMIVPGEDDTAPSRWPTIRSTATTLAALTMSEDSKRRLRFCLGWLMFATGHIDKQILLLKEFTEGLQKGIDNIPSHQQTATPSASTSDAASPKTPTDAEDVITPAQQATLAAFRTEIVNTVRQVVDIVSKYAGGSSPSTSPTEADPSSPSETKDSPQSPQEGLDESSRMRVKAFILSLPIRWKDAVIRMGVGPGLGGLGALNTPQASPSPPTGGSPTGGPTAVPVHQALATSQRILALATESLDMMRGVTGVVKESLERADGWLGASAPQQQNDTPRGRTGPSPANGEELTISPQSEWGDQSTLPSLSRRGSVDTADSSTISRTQSGESISSSSTFGYASKPRMEMDIDDDPAHAVA